MKMMRNFIGRIESSSALRLGEATLVTLVVCSSLLASHVGIGNLERLLHALVWIAAQIGIVHFKIERIVPHHAPDAVGDVIAFATHTPNRPIDAEATIIDLRSYRGNCDHAE